MTETVLDDMTLVESPAPMPEATTTVRMKVDGDVSEDAQARIHPTWTPEMLKVSYVGAFLYPTGYGEACRSNVKALKRTGAGVMARLNQMPHPGMGYELLRDDHEINETMDTRFWPQDAAQRIPDAWIWHVTPDEFQRMADRVNIGYTVWETEGLPTGWADACNRMDGILTASPYCERIFRESGVTVPIGVAPHPIDLDRFNPEADGKELRSTFGEMKTIFLVVSQLMFRKGVEEVLTAFGTEFKPDEGAGLILLSWRWSHSYKESRNVKGFIEYTLQHLNLGHPAPPIWFIGDKAPANGLPELYAACDAVVSASRGEAFGLPVFEAAATGKPSICTGYGGMWDYLDDESAYRVAYNMQTVNGGGPRWRHYQPHQKWARPDLDDLRAKMRQVHEDVEGRQQKGRAAFEVVANRLTYPVAGQTTQTAIKSILDKGSPKP